MGETLRINDIPIPINQVGVKFLSGLLFDPVTRPPNHGASASLEERTKEIVGWGVELFGKLEANQLDPSGVITYEDVSDLAEELRKFPPGCLPKIHPVIYTRGLVFLKETPLPTTKETLRSYMHNTQPGKVAMVSERDPRHIRLAIGSRLGLLHWKKYGDRYLGELFSN